MFLPRLTPPAPSSFLAAAYSLTLLQPSCRIHISVSMLSSHLSLPCCSKDTSSPSSVSTSPTALSTYTGLAAFAYISLLAAMGGPRGLRKEQRRFDSLPQRVADTARWLQEHLKRLLHLCHTPGPRTPSSNPSLVTSSSSSGGLPTQEIQTSVRLRCLLR